MFGPVQQVEHIGGILEGRLDGLPGNPDQLALDELLGHDPRVGFDIGRTGHTVGQFRDVGRPPAELQNTLLAQPLGHGKHVHRLRVTEKVLDGLEDFAVGILVKGARIEDIDDRIDRTGLQHAGPEHHLFELHGLRWFLSNTGHAGNCSSTLDGGFALVAEGFAVGHGQNGMKDQIRPHDDANGLCFPPRFNTCFHNLISGCETPTPAHIMPCPRRPRPSHRGMSGGKIPTGGAMDVTGSRPCCQRR